MKLGNICNDFRPRYPTVDGFSGFPGPKIEQLSMSIPGDRSAWVKTVKPKGRTRSDLDWSGQSDMATSGRRDQPTEHPVNNPTVGIADDGFSTFAGRSCRGHSDHRPLSPKPASFSIRPPVFRSLLSVFFFFVYPTCVAV